MRADHLLHNKRHAVHGAPQASHSQKPLFQDGADARIAMLLGKSMLACTWHANSSLCYIGGESLMSGRMIHVHVVVQRSVFARVALSEDPLHPSSL